MSCRTSNCQVGSIYRINQIIINFFMFIFEVLKKESRRYILTNRFAPFQNLFNWCNERCKAKVKFYLHLYIITFKGKCFWHCQKVVTPLIKIKGVREKLPFVRRVSFMIGGHFLRHLVKRNESFLINYLVKMQSKIFSLSFVVVLILGKKVVKNCIVVHIDTLT